MRKYQLWAWSDYYPEPWRWQWKGSFDTADEARAKCREMRDGDDYMQHYDHYEITTYDAAADAFVSVSKHRRH